MPQKKDVDESEQNAWPAEITAASILNCFPRANVAVACRATTPINFRNDRMSAGCNRNVYVLTSIYACDLLPVNENTIRANSIGIAGRPRHSNNAVVLHRACFAVGDDVYQKGDRGVRVKWFLRSAAYSDSSAGTRGSHA